MVGFKKYQPVGLRLWHWFNAVIVTGLLLTVLLRRTLFRTRANAEFIRTKAAEFGATVDLKAARKISEAMTDRFWDWHIYLGYSLAALLVARILVRFIHQEAPLRHALLGFQTYRAAPPKDKRDTLHYTVVRASYVLFYVAVLFMVLSGLAMIFQEELHLPSEFTDQLHEVHEWFQWYFLAFVILHIGGVLFAELGKYRGLVSDMIHGGDKPSRK